MMLFTPEMEITTPLLWHGSSLKPRKHSLLFSKLLAKGLIEIDAQDDNGKVLGSMVIEVDDTADDNHFADVPLSRQYERKWTHRYRAAQYKHSNNWRQWAFEDHRALLSM